MNIVKSLLIGLVMLSLSYSANVTISGVVTDTADIPIAGAAVKLLVGGQNTTTGSDGSFTLLGNNIGITVKPAQSQLYQPVVSLTKGQMKLHIQEQSSVTIWTYNLQGCLLTSMHTTLSTGDHSIALTNKSSGVYLYKVQINNNVYQIMSNSLCSYAEPVNTTQGTSAYLLSKQAKTLTAINDTISVRKDGYSDYLIPIHASDTSGIIIRMHWTLTVTDTDGNVYHTVKIGTQIWTAENLKTTKFNDGTAIPSGEPWGNSTTAGKYCWFRNDSATYKKTYGALYNWYAAHSGKLAPTGWHVPTDAEWDTLSAYLGGEDVAGGALKEAGTTHWESPNTGATNSSGFSALPGGYRNYDGQSCDIFSSGNWWSTTELTDNSPFANKCYIYSDNSRIYRSHPTKNYGFSVRLVRD
jgi:uncharacterized protein (TIGR02145 family)